jgi:hypothetical protein
MRHAIRVLPQRCAMIAMAALAACALAASAAPRTAKEETRYIDSRPGHLAPGICHLIRTPQTHARGAAADEGWSDSGAPEIRVWLDGGPIPCTAPQQSVQLTQSLPAPDIISLLQQQAALLQGARLLFAGNTSCARQRAYNFTLSALSAAPAERGAQAMYLLTYASDRDTTARVTIRKNRNEFTAWNVNCPLH